jgi:hypothetical protein
MLGDKSFAYDLVVERGVVSGRVALLLRSAETKPLIPDLFNEPLPVRPGAGALPGGFEWDWLVESGAGAALVAHASSNLITAAVGKETRERTEIRDCAYRRLGRVRFRRR